MARAQQEPNEDERGRTDLEDLLVAVDLAQETEMSRRGRERSENVAAVVGREREVKAKKRREVRTHPGMVLTRAALASFLDSILSPMARMAGEGGPTNATLISSSALANTSFSDRKP
jgi:hypothetical protein